MKRVLLFAMILLTACGGRQADYRNAENGLDAGREFIGACLEGDFTKAAFFMLPTEKNTRKLQEIEKTYRQNDKEGRQQLRSASINISEVSEPDPGTTIISYSNSFDKLPQTIKVIKQSGNWLVDITGTTNPVN